MIPKITRGGNTRGLLLYLVGPGRREEHVDPRLVAGSPEAMMIAGERVLDSRERDAALLAGFLDEPRETFGTRVQIATRDENARVISSREAHVWHCSLSLHPEEPALSNERWGELAERFVLEMGFAGDEARAQCRWVAVRHGVSVGGSDHVHLVVGLVAEDGTKASVHYDRPRAQQTARKLEAEFGLRELEARARGAGSRALEHKEIGADRRRGLDVGARGEHAERSTRQRLERTVRACAGASRSESEFLERVRQEGVHIRARYGTGGRDEVVGYSVRLAGPEDGRDRTVWYGGGRLARDLSLPALRRGWGQDHGEQQLAVGAWSSASMTARRSAAERRAELEERGLLWHRCTMEIERVRLALRAAGTDPTAIAHAAREGAAVLSAWSVAVEADRPAAIARAARQLARSAELRPRSPSPSPRRPSKASGLALFMLAAGEPDSQMGWLLVAREVTLLVGEVGRLHHARGEVERAKQIETELRDELEAIHSQVQGAPVGDPASLDADATAARRTRDPLAPPQKRERDERPEEADEARRVMDALRGRRPRRR
jgi:hypothetical protein